MYKIVHNLVLIEVLKYVMLQKKPHPPTTDLGKQEGLCDVILPTYNQRLEFPTKNLTSH